MTSRLFIMLVLGTLCGCDPHASHQAAPATLPIVEGSIDDRVTNLIASQAGVPRRDLNPGTRLNEDLQFDELDRVELTMELEEEFAITIDDQTALSLNTVAEVVQAVKHLAVKLHRTSDGIPIRPPVTDR